MDIGRLSERLMGMSEETWRRHANPWSGWTRLASYPLIFLAVWSNVWIGWYCLAPIAALAVWIWLNPRLFPRPKSTKSWMSRGVLGERVWINRWQEPIPPEHEKMANILSAIALAGVAVSVYGFWARDFWAAFMGWNLAVAAKMWFVDRMVWLFEDMKDKNAAYRAWLY
ncbi:conserved hypothetical protein [Desulfarculus baarsii DSM 2075]|uniref:Uncharacterized protein n=1 Tax=Desulfarculus baarsii (strain ATCC 33931 / DSM 2075 / LMG 7858 / VKM B-1802 / 2st14) TaxID=644282 RepID=E1QLG6_DESB2|nr:DUF6653 family protein [Desulfarculus baarsii]ADK86401.1 conserved hypothetical protein [Desulfarculus baarsii DSM 2075]